MLRHYGLRTRARLKELRTRLGASRESTRPAFNFWQSHSGEPTPLRSGERSVFAQSRSGAAAV